MEEMDEDRGELVRMFLAETGELLVELEESLLEVEGNPGDRDSVGRVFRALHTIKGNAAMFGFARVSGFTHELESVFARVNRGELAATRELVDLTLQARDRISAMMSLGPGDDQALSPGDAAIAARVRALAREAGEGGTSDGAGGEGEDRADRLTYHIVFRPFPSFFATGNDPLALLRELAEFGPCEVRARLEDIPALEDLDPQACLTGWDVILTTRRRPEDIRRVFLFVGGRCDLSLQVIDGKVGAAGEAPGVPGVKDARGRPESGTGGPENEDGGNEDRWPRDETMESIRVDSRKLDELVNLVGELVTVQARLSRAAGKGGEIDIASVAEEVERLTARLRDNVFDIRMVPIGAIFGRLRRLVRDLSREVGKEADLVTEGGKTELDKTIIARLGDPLMHMIRNSIGHGIETPDARAAAGKPRRGRVRLTAAQAGANIVVRVEDDGAGLDRVAIRAKARELGLIGPDEDPADQALFPLILHPGFSTAREVSSISGRGVGMDVVRKSVEDIKGILAIESRAGKGTTLTITLPMTLAIIQGLLVDVGEEHYVIPLDRVKECVELRHDGASTREDRMLLLHGELVPYLRLREWFAVAGERPALEQVVVAVTDEGRKVGLAVDRVMGEQQTVVKGLGRLLRKTEGLTGATVLGDGSPALILDVSRLAGLAGKEEEGVARWTAQT